MQNRYHRVAITVGIMLFLPLASSAACAPIVRTLKLGATGDDVRVLQQKLNIDKSTMIAASGPGSPGNETTYFGPATVRAVMKFQEMHKNEVLVPAGLQSASGIVGKLTRDAINRIDCVVPGTASMEQTNSLSESDVAALQARVNTAFQNMQHAFGEKSPSETIAANVAQAQSQRLANGSLLPPQGAVLPIIGTAGKYPLQLFMLSPLTVLRGDKITLSGTGFSQNTHLHIGSTNYVMSGGFATDTATFTIPSDIPYGLYSVALQDGGTLSNTRSLIIVEDKTKTPVIESITPTEGNVGTVITMKGQNFASKNDIVTTIGTIKDISSSDGKTLSFTLTAREDLLKDNRLLPYLPVSFSVMNMYGISGFTQFNIR